MQKTFKLMEKERTRLFFCLCEKKTTRFNLQKRSSQSGFLCIKKATLTKTDAIIKPKKLQNRILNGIIIIKGEIVWKISESNLKTGGRRAA